MPLVFLKAAGGFLLDLLGSRAGQILLAFLIAWFWSGHRANQKWEAQVAAERAAYLAAYRAEVARQESAAQDIAREATARLANEQSAAVRMQQQIVELEKAEKHAPTVILKGRVGPVCRPCSIDGDFARRMRDLDAAAGTRASSRRAR